MRKLGWVVGLAFAAVGGVGCGEPFTTTGGTGGTTTSSTSTGMGGARGASVSASASVGTGGQGGAVASASSSESSSSSSSSSGVAACTPTSCGTNTYCDSTKGVCVACTDFSRFHFAQPFALTVPLPGSGTARFPRMSPTDGTMYLTYTEGGSTLLASAPYLAFPKWSAAMLLPSPPNPASTTGADYLGPLFLPDGSTIHDLDGSIPSGAVLLFDAPGSNAIAGVPRKVFAYPASSGQAAVQLSLPGSTDTTSEWRIAVATDANRLFWLSSNPQGLVTAKPGDSASVAVPTALDDGSAGVANQPWVTPDGKILLFATTYAKQLITHVFWSELDATTGQAKGNATRIYPMDATDADGDPALASNACALLFTRNNVLWGALRD